MQCISVDDDSGDVAPLNLGMIAAYYYIRYTTIELFSLSLKKNTKLRGLLQIVAESSEYDALTVRRGEEAELRRMAAHVRAPLDNAKFHDAHTKANLLLQAHFERRPLIGDLARDQDAVLRDAPRLIQVRLECVLCVCVCMYVCGDTTPPLSGVGRRYQQ